MKLDEFFRGLFARRLSGSEQIITHLDAHHESFQRFVDKLERVHDEYREVPGTFVPSPFTGRCRDLDSVLIRSQQGLLRSQGPFHPCIHLHLDISESRAKRIMGEYTPGQPRLFKELALEFIGRAAETRRAA
jgi:hypothetical protein